MENAIVMENLSHSYGEKPVLKGINLIIPKGQKTGIVGESGSGKSTLIKLISGLFKVQSGTLSVNGDTAVVMQSLSLFPLTIRENITCGHDIPEEKIAAALQTAQLSDWISTLPDGLETFTGERGGQVSGGQAQRISIARAIAKDAPILILDEATSALDVKTADRLMASLSTWWKDRTVITIAHRPEALSYCDVMYRLEDGVLTEEKHA